MTETKRGRGRPRTRPVGSKKRSVYLTDAEFDAIRFLADRDEISAEEWMRRRVIHGHKTAKTQAK